MESLKRQERQKYLENMRQRYPKGLEYRLHPLSQKEQWQLQHRQRGKEKWRNTQIVTTTFDYLWTIETLERLAKFLMDYNVPIYLLFEKDGTQQERLLP